MLTDRTHFQIFVEHDELRILFQVKVIFPPCPVLHIVTDSTYAVLDRSINQGQATTLLTDRRSDYVKRRNTNRREVVVVVVVVVVAGGGGGGEGSGRGAQDIEEKQDCSR